MGRQERGVVGDKRKWVGRWPEVGGDRVWGGGKDVSGRRKWAGRGPEVGGDVVWGGRQDLWWGKRKWAGRGSEVGGVRGADWGEGL